MSFNSKIQAWNVLLLLKNYCYCPFLALLLLLLTIAKGLPELLLLLLISDLPELLLLLLIEKFSIDQLWYFSLYLFRFLWNMLLPLPELPERRAYGQEWNSLRAPRMGAPLRSAPDHARWLEGSQQHRREHLQWCSRSFLLHLLRFNSDRQWVGLPSGKAVKAVVYCTLKCLIKTRVFFLLIAKNLMILYRYPVFGALTIIFTFSLLRWVYILLLHFLAFNSSK